MKRGGKVEGNPAGLIFRPRKRRRRPVENIWNTFVRTFGRPSNSSRIPREKESGGERDFDLKGRGKAEVMNSEINGRRYCHRSTTILLELLLLLSFLLVLFARGVKPPPPKDYSRIEAKKLGGESVGEERFRGGKEEELGAKVRAATDANGVVDRIRRLR